MLTAFSTIPYKAHDNIFRFTCLHIFFHIAQKLDEKFGCVSNVHAFVRYYLKNRTFEDIKRLLFCGSN